MPYADPVKRRINNAHRQASFRVSHSSFRRDQHLRLTFGMTQPEWDDLFASQGFVCASCGSDKAGRTKQGKDGCWHTDHNPDKIKGEPGFVRGILCHWCNIALHKHQTPRTLRLLALYLEKH